MAIVGNDPQDRYGNVSRPTPCSLGLLSVAGAAAGVALANALSGAVLRDAFAGLMLLVAAQLVRRTLRRSGVAPAGVEDTVAEQQEVDQRQERDGHEVDDLGGEPER